MTNDLSLDMGRRAMLKGAAGLGLALTPLLSCTARAAAAAPASAVPGNDDFGFLTGDWKIVYRALKTPGGSEWSAIESKAKVHAVQGGLGSIEQLSVPASRFLGMGVRVFNVDKGLWADHWVSAQNGVVNPPMMGSFKDGVGTFTIDDTDDGKPVIWRGTWDRITPTSCRWWQSTSRDGGKTWVDNTFMDWTRA